jgi:NAD(P)-dependent dehydrogenase (short-subunit alcohol dehydrogenase family)
MDLGLKGKRAVVTGGTRGIGRAIAETLAAEGASVAICARKASEVEQTVAALKSKGVEAYGAVVDIAQAEVYKAWIESAAQAMGGIDIFVANVSGGPGMGEAAWRTNFEVDLLGTTRGIEAAMPALKASGAGSIVIISSTAAVETFLMPQPYNAIKAALITHGKQLSQAVAADGIRVNCVSPGPIYFPGGAWQYFETNMPEVFKSTQAQIARGSMGTPQEVANAVVFLASPAASLITGVNLVADGGFTKRVQL